MVEVINSGYSKDATLMHLLRAIFFISAHHDFAISLGKGSQQQILSPGTNLQHFFTGLYSSATPILHTSVNSGLGDPIAARLVVARLVSLVQELFAAGTAVSTKKVYSTATNTLPEVL